jgi:L-amino acid N-acyltransferase YncA
MTDPLIREGTLEDAHACADIYAPYVTDTVATFELEPPGAEEIARRINASHAWLVAEVDGLVVGYAYGSTHRERAAYRWAADVAIYVAPSHHRRGLGRALYAALFEVMRGRGLRVLCAGVTQPNPASDGLHRAMGFDDVGVFRRIGWKHGAWRDVRWYQLDLAPDDDSAPPVVTVGP